MKPQIHRIIKLTEAQLVLKLHTAALMYSNYVDTTLLFIFSKGKGKNPPMEYMKLVFINIILCILLG